MNVWENSKICAEAEREQWQRDRNHLKSVNPRERGPSPERLAAYLGKKGKPVNLRTMRGHFKVTRMAMLESLHAALQADLVLPYGKSSYIAA